jgi:hypothetical protein
MLLSIAMTSIAWTRMSMPRLSLTLALLAEHVIACIYNYQYAQTAIADAWAYYYDPLHWGTEPWGLSTILVTQITHILKVRFGATYFDCFFFFQAISMGGVALLTRTFDEIEANVGVPALRGYWALLFLPSVHFWTVAIGKDSPLFLAVSLAVWSMLSLRKRFVWFGLAMVIMVLFRAHIALMAVTALAAASFFGKDTTLGRRIGLLFVALVGMVLVLGPVQETIGADVTSASGVQDFLDKKITAGEHFAGTTSIGHASFPFKVFSLLFRPFFVDATGVPGVVASAENVLVVFMLIYTIMHWRDLILLARRVLFIRFNLIFAGVLLLGLAILYYNVGLGLRQRVMAYPMIFSVIVSMWALRRKNKMEAPPQPARGLMPSGNANRPLHEH